MITRTGKILIIGLAVIWSTSAAMAVTGQALAARRAFSYAYNNPRQEDDSGPLGSSMYWGSGSSTFNVPHGPGGAPSSFSGYSDTSALMSQTMRTSRVYTPMAAAQVSATGGTAMLARDESAYSNPIRAMGSALAANNPSIDRLQTSRLTSLAPQTPGKYRDAMLQGETAFREGKYADAEKAFVSAAELSRNSAESMLSLAQANIAIGGEKAYAQAAVNLANALDRFPDLPLVRIDLAGFFGSEKAYQTCVNQLQNFVKAHPKDAAALYLLGYVQWRQGMVDQSLASLDAAMKVTENEQLIQGITAMINGIVRSGKIIISGAPDMQKAKDYSWAGIRIAMPVGFLSVPLASSNQVLEGIVDTNLEGGDYPVILAAYPVQKKGVTLKAFMDAVTNYMRRSPGFENMKFDQDAEVRFQVGGQALLRFCTAKREDGGEITMGWLAFMRDVDGSQEQRIGYLLGVSMPSSQRDKLLSTLAGIAKTASMIPVKTAAPGDMDVQGNTIVDHHYGFSIVQPYGWAGRQTDKGVQMGQVQYRLGNVISPKVEVIVLTIPDTYTAKSFGEEALKRRTQDDAARKLLSEGEARMGNHDGYQFVISRIPPGGSAKDTEIFVGRAFCMDRADDHKTLYALTVECRGTDAKGAAALTDKLAANFKLVQRKGTPLPQTEATTEP